MSRGRISIVINNYNYGRFLGVAIESLLSQTVKPHEVIVVDDGSTDNSRQVLKKYISVVKVIEKSNGGQASAFNAGFNASTGDWIWFVDADDFLLNRAVEIVNLAIGEGISKIHSPLVIVQKDDSLTTELYPYSRLSSGDVIPEILDCGDYKWPPTTGNIFHRSVLEQCMPIPEKEYRLSADYYLCSIAPFCGKVAETNEPVGCYRIHPDNRFYGVTFDKTRLNAIGSIYLKVAERTQELVRRYTEYKGWCFPFTRRTLESLIISKRFGNLSLPTQLSGSQIHRKWFDSVEIKNASVKTKVPAIIYWLLLNFSPLFIATFFIKRGIKKNIAASDLKSESVL